MFSSIKGRNYIPGQYTVVIANVGTDILFELLFSAAEGTSDLIWQNQVSGTFEYSDINTNMLWFTSAFYWNKGLLILEDFMGLIYAEISLSNPKAPDLKPLLTNLNTINL